MEHTQGVFRAVIESIPTHWTDYVSVICLVLTLFVAGISAVYAKKSYTKQQARSKKEAACNLAKIYADEFLPGCQYVSTVMYKAGLLSYAKKAFPLEKINYFDEKELNSILEQKEILKTDVDEKYAEIDVNIIYESALNKFDSMIDAEIMRSSDILTPAGIVQLNDMQKDFLKTKYNMEITRLLNWLEWFSMNARYGIVDEEVLFQSLHQTFISTVWQFYYYIAKSNKNVPGDKYYTNIKWLFEKWVKRLNEIKSEAETKSAIAHKLNNDIRDSEFAGSPV